MASLDMVNAVPLDDTLLFAASKTFGTAILNLVTFITTFIFRCASFVTYTVPTTIYAILHYSFTIQFRFTTVLVFGFCLLGATYWVYRNRYLKKYEHLKDRPLQKDSSFDLHPDRIVDYEDDGKPAFRNYLDDFLSGIKIFGYLEKPVFHELARYLQTKKLVAGDALDLAEDRSFYIVVDGCVQVYGKTRIDEIRVPEEDEYLGGYQLMNEVKVGETLSSLFTILKLFTEDVKLRYEERDPDENDRRNGDSLRDVPSVADVPELPERTLGDSKIFSSSPSASEDVPIDRHKKSKSSSSSYASSDGASFRTQRQPSSRQYSLTKQLPNDIHIIARATQDSTLAVIPPEAFRRVTRRFPNASAHIVQVILTRLQRVTFYTAHKYLGLTTEVLKTEKVINDLACYPLPSHFYQNGGMERLRTRFSSEKSRINAGRNHYSSLEDESVGGVQAKENTADRARSHASKAAGDLHSMTNSDGPSEVLAIVRGTPTDDPAAARRTEEHGVFANSPIQANSGHPSSSHFPFKALSPNTISFLEESLDLKELVMGCISKSIGLHHSSPSPSPSAEASPKVVVSDSILQKALLGSSFGRLTMLEAATDDSSSVFSSSSTIGAGDIENEIDIRFWPKDSMLARAGERNAGLYYVIDGFLDVSRPAEDPHTHLAALKKKQQQSRRASSQNRHNMDSPRAKRPKMSAGIPSAFYKSKTSSSEVLFTVKPGGIAGYLASLSGSASYVDITAKTDAYIGFLSAASLEKIMERKPIVLLTLAKRLISLLSPLMLHIDACLDWMQVDAGKVLYREEDSSDAFFIVLNGRLRTINEMDNGEVNIRNEYGQGDIVGELDVLTASPRPSTCHAIRDTELVRMPSTLYNAIAQRHPSITAHITKILAHRVRIELSSRATHIASAIRSRTHGRNNFNLKTIGILPVTSGMSVVEFARHLKNALMTIGGPVAALHQASVMSVLGRHAFSKMGKLKLSSWLSEQEQFYRTVLYVCDTPVNSAWTQTCIRQADCLLLIANGESDPSVGDFERLLLSMKTTARKELVIVHPERFVVSGSTRLFLKDRPWVHAHHHVEMPSLFTKPHMHDHEALKGPKKALRDIKNKVQNEVEKYRQRRHLASARMHGGGQADFFRLARRLVGKSVGVVLGGGGARGIAHLGFLQALEEKGIQIDMIGGTSIGSLVGGLYARESHLLSSLGRTKQFAGRMASLWRLLTDITYPAVAYTTGHEFNRGIYKAFSDYSIEDLWLPFFANTTDITFSRMRVHTTGYAWRYVRASMSLAGLLPPLCDLGSMLVDGGYVDNLPVSVMLSMGADTVFAVDVGSVDDTSPQNYGDSLSGWLVWLSRWNPWSAYRNIPGVTEIQSRLTYVSSVRTLEEAKTTPGVLYMQMPVQQYGTMQFGKYEEIRAAGLKASKDMLDEFEREEKLPQGIFSHDKSGQIRDDLVERGGRGVRRHSIG